jgi:tetratricopeptide (TPR) repeat protein
MRDPTPLAYQVASAILVHRRQHEEAIVEAKRAIAADPNDADGYAALSRALSFAGRPREALEAIERAMRLNPHFPSTYEYLRGLALFGMDRLPDAAASLERAGAMNPDDYWSLRLLLATYGLLGRGEDAARLAEAANKTRREDRDPLSVRGVSFWYPFANADDTSRFANGLRRAGLPD